MACGASGNQAGVGEAVVRWRLSGLDGDTSTTRRTEHQNIWIVLLKTNIVAQVVRRTTPHSIVQTSSVDVECRRGVRSQRLRPRLYREEARNDGSTSGCGGASVNEHHFLLRGSGDRTVEIVRLLWTRTDRARRPRHRAWDARKLAGPMSAIKPWPKWRQPEPASFPLPSELFQAPDGLGRDGPGSVDAFCVFSMEVVWLRWTKRSEKREKKGGKGGEKALGRRRLELRHNLQLQPCRS